MTQRRRLDGADQRAQAAALPAPERELQRALELAESALGRAYPNPTVGAVVVADGEVVGEGVTEAYGGRHGEVVALDAAGERSRGSTLYLTMEPCTHHGRTPPCVDRVLAAGVARVVAGSLDPNPEAAGGLERLREAGVEVELAESVEARRQNEAWRTWVAEGRPFVTYKAAVTLDGRMTLPGERWISGEESRRLVHELRAASDAVAVGAGLRSPGGCPWDAEQTHASLRGYLLEEAHEAYDAIVDDDPAAMREELGDVLLQVLFHARVAAEAEPGRRFDVDAVAGDLVDKLVVFVAPVLGGAGPGLVGELPEPRDLTRLDARAVGDDVLLSAYVHEP